MYAQEKYEPPKARALKAQPSQETLADIRGMNSVQATQPYEGTDVEKSAQPEIQREVHDLEKFSHVIHEIISHLENRISSALVNAPELAEKMAVRQRDTALGNFIGESNDRLRAATYRLQSISERIAF